MHIRAEQPRDHDAIDNVVTAAFGQPDEARLVRLLRASDAYIPELALVADDGVEISGHIMVSYAELKGDTTTRVLSLAPLAVRPGRQRTGIGIALTTEALRVADERGEPLVVVLGHPGYYPRFGFEPSRSYGIEPHDAAVPDEVFMVLPLTAYDPSLRGTIVYPPAFDEVG